MEKGQGHVPGWDGDPSPPRAVPPCSVTGLLHALRQALDVWLLLLTTLPARRREGDRKDGQTKCGRVPGRTPGQHLMVWRSGACCQDAGTPSSPVPSPRSGCAGPPVPSKRPLRIPILGLLQPPGTEKSERGARWPLRSNLGWLWTRFWAGTGAAGLEQAGRCAGVPRPSCCQVTAA